MMPQGVFGSVYTAMWQGRMVAVKIIKFEADGRKTLRTAWELAVAKSVQHANVVKVSQSSPGAAPGGFS